MRRADLRNLERRIGHHLHELHARIGAAADVIDRNRRDEKLRRRFTNKFVALVREFARFAGALHSLRSLSHP